MLITVIGGKLQGVEITYLAQKAGYEVLLIDKNDQVPAFGLCDRFVQANVLNDQEIKTHLEQCDIIFPAFENLEGLTRLSQICQQINKPLVFDLNAYTISSSKLASDQLFTNLKLSQPALWPDCDFPIVVKPSDGSGSNGVKIFTTHREAQQYYQGQFPPTHCVVQQYNDGPSYSIEVIGSMDKYQAFQITEIVVDAAYDCKRVTAPVGLPKKLVQDFEALGIIIAEALKLKGIMDVEVILHEDQLKVLEIDARFPSQTPITVYWSSGVNMVQESVNLFLDEKFPTNQNKVDGQFVIFEHITVNEESIQVQGEHIIVADGPLHLEKHFFGADEAITNYQNEKKQWVATLIMVANTEAELKYKKIAVINSIKNQHNINKVIDLDPIRINQ